MGFQVNVQPSGRQFEVLADETVLDAGIRQNIGLPYGCKDGACGSCKCQKISGEVVHKPYQPSALTQEELAKGLVLTCKDKLIHYYAKFGFVNEGVSASVHGNVTWYQMRLTF